MASFAPQTISGLASGLDTSSIISALMQVEAQPQTLIKQRQAVEQVRQQALTDIQTRVTNLQGAITGLRDSGTWSDQQTVDSSDTTKLTATRTAGAAAGAFQISITSLARADQYKSATLTGVANSGTLTVGVGSSSVSVNVAAGASLDAIANQLNGASGTPVYASVVNSQLVLSSRTTGASNTISISGGADLTAELGFTRSIIAADASYSLDGVPKTSSSNTITTGLPGIQLVLKAATASPVTVSVGAPTPSTTAIQAKIQAFVDQYNSTIDFIQGKLTEKRVANPQTSSDRAKGVLNGDPSLTNLLSSLRTAVADIVQGRPASMQSLAQAGLSTGSAVGSGTLNQDALEGKLTLDTAKLSAALTTSLGNVKALFVNGSKSYASQGLGERLSTIVNGQLGTGGILTNQITNSNTQISQFTKSIADWDLRLSLRQKALTQQFTTMESALSKLQSQGSWLSSQVTSLGSGR